ncbi:hypothetical protein GGS21DRAFT_507492 [Xylaria nigripes]|nr:hypothetical protein GGS21DRAFT_507492 [Xylaria nigripes]
MLATSMSCSYHGSREPWFTRIGSALPTLGTITYAVFVIRKRVCICERAVLCCVVLCHSSSRLGRMFYVVLRLWLASYLLTCLLGLLGDIEYLNVDRYYLCLSMAGNTTRVAFFFAFRLGRRALC